MWIPDIRPDAGFLVGAAVAVAATSPVQAADNYVYGVCRVARPGYDTMIRPTYAGGSYLFNYHGNDPRYKEKLSSGEFFAGAKVTLIKAPAHGKVIREEGPWSSETDYQYRPDEDYAGKDRFVMQVEKHGVKVRIHYLMVVPQEGESLKGHCNPESWKISSSFTTPTLDKAALQSLLDATGINNAVTVTTAELSGGAVGQTTGSTITLDTDAAGYSWYIDYTPYLNDEYLPTSNPNEWVAKAGTDAANKIDLLSVLLHEYGHAVGLDHTADGHNYMAATLQPSVRRLPSSEELSLMAQLAGQAKLALEGNGTPDTPQSPGLPIGAGLSALLVGRLRSTRYGSWSPAFDSVQIPAPVPQFEVAANPTLANGKLESGEGWATQGNVAIANGQATLSEVSASQTRLNQVFVVGPHDRYLSFTIAGIALDDQASNGSPLPNPLVEQLASRLGPQAGKSLVIPLAGEGANGAASGSGMGPSDAFEAAMLDANSGASLLGGTGLTHNDAFLNLQADGTERAGPNRNLLNVLMQGVTPTPSRHQAQARGDRPVPFRGFRTGRLPVHPAIKAPVAVQGAVV